MALLAGYVFPLFLIPLFCLVSIIHSSITQTLSMVQGSLFLSGPPTDLSAALHSPSEGICGRTRLQPQVQFLPAYICLQRYTHDSQVSCCEDPVSQMRMLLLGLQARFDYGSGCSCARLVAKQPAAHLERADVTAADPPPACTKPLSSPHWTPCLLRCCLAATGQSLPCKLQSPVTAGAACCTFALHDQQGSTLLCMIYLP